MFDNKDKSIKGYKLGEFPGVAEEEQADRLMKRSRLPHSAIGRLCCPHRLAALLRRLCAPSGACWRRSWSCCSLTALLDSQHNYWHNPRASAVDILRQTALLGIFALGAAIVIIAGGIDLSSGSVIAFSGRSAPCCWRCWPHGCCMPSRKHDSGVGDRGGHRRDLIVGLLIGSLHAWLITVVGLPPFVATLATLVGLRSLGRAADARTSPKPSGRAQARRSTISDTSTSAIWQLRSGFPVAHVRRAGACWPGC